MRVVVMVATAVTVVAIGAEEGIGDIADGITTDGAAGVVGMVVRTTAATTHTTILTRTATHTPTVITAAPVSRSALVDTGITGITANRGDQG